MDSNVIPWYDSSKPFLRKILLSSDTPGQGNWIIMKAVCLTDAEFNLSVFGQRYTPPLLHLKGFDYVSFPS